MEIILNTLKAGISILTPEEYIIALAAMTLSSVVTELIKRHIVWKKEGRKQGILKMSFWGLPLEVPKVAIIGIIIAFLFTLSGFYFNGSELGKMILIPITVGFLTPATYKLTIWFCRKKGWHDIANFISGDRREKVREG